MQDARYPWINQIGETKILTGDGICVTVISLSVLGCEVLKMKHGQVNSMTCNLFSLGIATSVDRT